MSQPVSDSTDRQMLLDLWWSSPNRATENVNYHEPKHLVGPGEMAQVSSLSLMSQNSHLKKLNIGAWWHVFVTPVLDRQRWPDLWGSGTSQLSVLDEPSWDNETLSQKKKKRKR